MGVKLTSEGGVTEAPVGSVNGGKDQPFSSSSVQSDGTIPVTNCAPESH